MSDEPEVRDNPDDSRFEIWSDGELAGFLQYETMRGARALIHTEIDERFAGRGLGAFLVRAVLTTLRDDQVPVLPYCPFVRSYLQRHPEFVDLVPADRRERFDLPAS